MADLPATPRGRPSYLPLLMVKLLLLQQWYEASDPAMGERLSFRRFAGFGLQDRAPDHSTISRFRTHLAITSLAEALFAAVKQQLATCGVLTPANVNDTQVADGLIAGDEAAVYGDAAYGTHARSALLRRLGIQDQLMRRPSKHPPG